MNGNGTPDGGEPGLAGWRVYLDTNQNGQWDTDERTAVTDDDEVTMRSQICFPGSTPWPRC